MRLKLWIKAFIPNQLFDTTGQELTFRMQLLNEINLNQNISLLPWLYFFPDLFASYATDQRSFSEDINASARLTTIIEIPDISAAAMDQNKIKVSRNSDPSIQISNDWQGYLSKRPKKVASLTEEPQGKQHIKKSGDAIHILFSSAATNPFFNFAGIKYAPAITMNFKLEIRLLAEDLVQLSLNGDISQFPAFEAYVQLGDNQPISLFQHAPAQGNTPFNLFFGLTKKSVCTTLKHFPSKEMSYFPFFQNEKQEKDCHLNSSNQSSTFDRLPCRL